jgi:hypothetical protein
MMKALLRGGLATAAVLVGSTHAFAQTTSTATVNVTVGVNARAVLTLDTSAITWNDADPDSVSSFTSAPIAISTRARTTAGSTISLTVQADDDLTSGSDTISISNLTWTVTGAGFVPGTSSSAAAQTVASFSNSGNRSGTQTYSLPNSWDYAVGTYTAQLTYTLTAP